MWKDAPSHICRGGDLRGLAFCCPPIKYCPIHQALNILKLSPEEFIKLKEEFGKRSKLGLGKNTCFGSLVWCCKITKPCPYRDLELRKNNISPEEYMKLKKELAEYILKNSPWFKESVEILSKKFPKEDVERALLETGDLEKAYKLLKMRK
ncbi:methanogenesis marker 9 domain-containing protein [Methanocaldococcus indicus]|uniref:methanogenesis marker 9 domain-containing protein n=1 Tax=Methanocaldococcus indicus TaxID=213231 RepID=UPI003C6D0F75